MSQTAGATFRPEMGSTPGSPLQVGEERITLLIDGEQTYPAMLEAISHAKRTICLETYILRDDFTGQRFAAALCERARAGVEVNVLYDAWGSALGPDFLAQLEEAGVRTLAFRPLKLKGRVGRWFAHFRRRNHRKVLVVDGQVGFTGGLNIADDYASRADSGHGWRDTHVRLEGPSAGALEALFLRTWVRNGGATLLVPRDPPRTLPSGAPEPAVQVIASGFWNEGRRIRALYLEAVRTACTRICITSAYFLPSRRFLRALANAARRGVEVELITAGETDVPLVKLAAHGVYGPLLRAGVRIYEYEGRVLHAKTAVFDTRMATVGSSNLDTLSLQVNLELNVTVASAPFARILEAQFERDRLQAREITRAAHAQRSWFDRTVSAFALLFREWL